MNKEQAINYLISSGMTEEQVTAVSDALINDHKNRALDAILAKMDSIENPSIIIGMTVAMGILRDM